MCAEHIFRAWMQVVYRYRRRTHDNIADVTCPEPGSSGPGTSVTAGIQADYMFSDTIEYACNKKGTKAGLSPLDKCFKIVHTPRS